MLSFDQSFDNLRQVGALVVPIGTNSLYDKQYADISKIKEVALLDVRPNGWAQALSPFKYMRWDCGYFLFEFFRYDKARLLSDLDNYQPSRRIQVLIGLINYPELGSTDIDNEIKRYLKRYPHILTKRIFLFNYPFDGIASSVNLPTYGHQESGTLEVFPPDQDCDGGNMIEIHLREVMATISRKFFTAIEQQIEGFADAKARNSPPHPPLLQTNFDDVGASAKKTTTPKRQIGRLKKWMADLAMQICAIGDAMELYVAAIADLRSVGDSMWLAGALEGLSAAIFVVLKLGLKIEDYLGDEILLTAQVSAITVEIAAFRLAEERHTEAVFLLSRTEHCSLLAAESSVRLAHTLCYINSCQNYFAAFEDGRVSRVPSSAGQDDPTQDKVIVPDVMYENGIFIRNYDSRHERRIKVIDLILRAAELPELSNMQAIECILCGAVMCRFMKMHRKYIFLMYRAASLYIEQQEFSISASMLKILIEDIFNSPGANAIPHLWKHLFRGVLKSLATSAQEIGDFKCAANSVSNLLQLISSSLNEQTNLGSTAEFSDELMRAISDTSTISSFSADSVTVDPLSDRFTEFNSEYSFPTVLSSPLNVLRKFTSQKSADEFERSRLSTFGSPNQQDRKSVIFEAFDSNAGSNQLEWGCHISSIEQQDAWKLFSKIYQTLHHGYQSDLRTSLFLLLRPIEIPCDVLPKKGKKARKVSSNSLENDDFKDKENQSKSQQALFYNPFAARREAQDARKVTEYTWYDTELGVCVVYFRNRFAVPLLLQNIVVEWSNPSSSLNVIPVPQTMLLPPRSCVVKLELRTKINSLHDTNLQAIRAVGIRFSIYSSSIFIPIDSQGYPTISGELTVAIKNSLLSGLDIRKVAKSALKGAICSQFSVVSISDNKEVLIPNLATISLSVDPIVTMRSDEVTMNVSIVEKRPIVRLLLQSALTCEECTSIRLYKGESKKFNLVLKNEGKAKISNFRLSMRESTRGTERVHVLLDYINALQGSTDDFKSLVELSSSGSADFNDYLFGCTSISSREILGESYFKLLLLATSTSQAEKENKDFEVFIDIDIPYESSASDENVYLYHRTTLVVKVCDEGFVIAFEDGNNFRDVQKSQENITVDKHVDELLLQLLENQRILRHEADADHVHVQLLRYPKLRNDFRVISSLASYPLLLSTDQEFQDKVINEPSLLREIMNVDKKISWFNLDSCQNELCEAKAKLLVKLAPKSVSNLILSDLDQTGTPQLNWLLQEPDCLRHGLAVLKPTRSFTNEILPFFCLDLKLGDESSPYPLSLNRFYPVYISGKSSRQALESLVSVEVTVIVLENASDTDSAASKLGTYGSKKVVFSGQPYKIIYVSQLDISESSDFGVPLSHTLNICFLNTAPSTIYLVWKENTVFPSSPKHWVQSYAIGQNRR